MRHDIFDSVLKEYFDTSDRKSIRTLLSLNEAEQNQVMVALASKLYKKIVDKVDDIDFGTIPTSKGDITKIGNFQEMIECMSVIREILVHYKQDTCQLDIIDRAIENIRDSKKTWEKAFAVESELPMTFYNTICLSIVSSVSLLISSSIDFISSPGEGKSFQISFDNVAYNKTKDKLLFQNLDKFNKAYTKGDIEKLMNAVIKETANVKESTFLSEEEVVEELALEVILGVVATGVFAATLLTLVVPVLHVLVNTLYCARQSVSEYFEIQAKIVQFNAEQLKYDYTKSDAEIKKIYDKQMKIADSFKKISNALAIKMNKADKDARRMVEQDKSEKLKYDDLEVRPNNSSIF